jgi:hypothetical protein
MTTEIDELLFRARRCDELASGCLSAWVATRFRHIASDYRELAAERASRPQFAFGSGCLGGVLQSDEGSLRKRLRQAAAEQASKPQVTFGSGLLGESARE